METQVETYNVKVVCKNCGLLEHIDIPRKVMVENHPCPKCGNEVLKRCYEYKASPLPKEFNL